MDRERVEVLFSKVFKTEEIDFIEKAPLGYSNETYKVVDKKGKAYKVRIAGNNELIDRNNELCILKHLGVNYLFFDKETGDSVWEWQEGENITREQLDEEIIFKLIEVVNKIHTIKPTDVKNHDDLEYLEKTRNLIDKYYLDKYIQILNKYENDERVLCHNDISLSNILYDFKNSELKLIDYEWGRVNNVYWDYGNFIKESDLSEYLIAFLSHKARLSIYKLFEFAFVASVYSLQLSYMFKFETEGIRLYRKRIKKQMAKYLTWLNRL